MADEPNPNPNPPAVDPSPPPPPPEVEAFDADGVPFKNRAAEFQRKYEESERAKEALLQAIQAGRQPAPPEPPKAGIDDILKQYKPEDQAALRALFTHAVTEAEQRARTVGYKMMTEVGVQTELQKDPEVLREAQAAYQRLKQNPVWAGADDLHVQYTALQEAKAAVAARRPGGGGIPAPVTLPTNRGGGAPPAPADSKEKFIKEWIASADANAFYEKYLRNKFAKDSPQGQAAFREAAEIAWSEQQKDIPYFGPNSKVGQAVQAILNQAKGAV